MGVMCRCHMYFNVDSCEHKVKCALDKTSDFRGSDTSAFN